VLGHGPGLAVGVYLRDLVGRKVFGLDFLRMAGQDDEFQAKLA
jgi:hypothetical protein